MTPRGKRIVADQYLMLREESLGRGTQGEVDDLCASWGINRSTANVWAFEIFPDRYNRTFPGRTSAANDIRSRRKCN